MNYTTQELAAFLRHCATNMHDQVAKEKFAQAANHLAPKKAASKPSALDGLIRLRCPYCDGPIVTDPKAT